MFFKKVRDTLYVGSCISVTQNVVARVVYGHVVDLLLAGMLLVKYGLPSCFKRASLQQYVFAVCLATCFFLGEYYSAIKEGSKPEEAVVIASGYSGLWMLGAGKTIDSFRPSDREVRHNEAVNEMIRRQIG